MEKSEPLYTVCGNINWNGHYGKQCGVSSEIKIRTNLWSSKPNSGYIYPRETKSVSWKDIYTFMFIWALFTIAKTWKKPRCLSTDEWIKNMWCVMYIHTHTYTHVSFLSLSLIYIYIYLSISLSSIYLCIYVSIYLSISLLAEIYNILLYTLQYSFFFYTPIFLHFKN